MPRHLLQQSVDRLTAMAEPPAAAMAGGATSAHTNTVLIVIAVLCFLLCVVGLAMVARCSMLCNPSAFSVDGPAAKAPCGGLEKTALQSLPTVSWRPGQREVDEEEGERPECAICLAEFARGDEVRVLPHCGHGFHAACVDVWLLSSSTCPSCRRALVVVSPAPPTTHPPARAATCCAATGAGSGSCRSSSAP
ncbi:RING-H2 finger protein ATL74-like [Triticum dicoccoides]|uniref:RING-H2 finger protein ATL74-like n=1 Tax=Triticum dicoccoides TaxID=85692 RepID=UPI00188EC478|nr:RING-H2 finger protein ATL74-like [Triticum dicoccoides]